MIVVLDTAAVTGLAPIDERRRARLRALRARATDFVTPAAVLAEGVLSGHPGRDYHVRRLLEIVDVADVDEHLGFAAGSLRTAVIRAGGDPPPSGVDAIVAALADLKAGHVDVEIVTSDGDDMELLAAFSHHHDRVTVTII